MTREEKQKAIDALKISAPIMAVTQEEFTDYIQTLNKIMDWLEQESSGDLISRQAVNTLVDELARAISDERCCMSRGRSTATIMQDILDLPSVNPQEPKTGHWIEKAGFDGDTYYDCSECGESFCLIDGTPTDNLFDYCPNCGVRMESEGDKE